MELKTPLYECHVSGGGKIVPFAGYLMPVQYGSGVIAEHTAVRTKAGLFDVSHMGEIMFEGPDALKNIQHLVTNDCAPMKVGKVKYTLMCNDEGGIVDDLLVYKLGEEKYMFVANAANRHKDVAWVEQHVSGDVTIKDVSNDIAQIALQGPLSLAILSKLTKEEFIPVKNYTFIEKCTVADINCIISRTGYTGEDGFELYCASLNAPALWNSLLEAGRDEGLIPCGLGARDTLRLEAAMPLYGHEMDDSTSPFEVGLHSFVKLTKEDFIGEKAIMERDEPTKTRVGMQMVGRGIAREHCDVYVGDMQIGSTTSGTYCPYIGRALAMAMVDIDHCRIGTQVTVDVRGRRIDAEIIALPFYSRKR